MAETVKKDAKTPAQQGAPRIVIEAEQATLGSALIEKQATRRALDMLRAEDFHAPDHQAIFKCIEKVFVRDGEVDTVTLVTELRAAGKLDNLGMGIQPDPFVVPHDPGPAYVVELINRVTTAAHVEYYAKLVKEASLDREFSRQLTTTYTARTPENVKKLHELMNALHGVHHRAAFDFRKDLHAYLDEVLDKKPAETIDTGFVTLDQNLGGLNVGDVTVIGARTSGGKTACMTKTAVQIAEAFAAKEGDKRTCLYYTTEMTEEQVVSRVMPMAAHVEAWKFRRKNFTEAESLRILAACRDRLSTLPLLVMGKSQPSLADISSAIAQTKPRAVFLDYLQRFKFGDGDSRAYQIMDFMIGLKTLAQDTKTNIFLGCQLDRKLDKTAPEPENADLKDSGAIEAEADQVILLWKPNPKDLAKEVGNLPLKPGHHLIRYKVSKNRHGSAWGRGDFALNGPLVDMAEHIVEIHAPDSRLPKEEMWS
jgi:replicative DNA helicase